jgi:hypothetical protein
VVLSFGVGKELAPLKDRDVHEIAVGSDPKLPRYTDFRLAIPSCAIERDVAQAMFAENCRAPNAVFSGQSQCFRRRFGDEALVVANRCEFPVSMSSIANSQRDVELNATLTQF